MEQIKTFSIFKNTKKTEGSTQPDYKLSVKIGDEYIECGAGWIKDGKSGKFISVKLSDAWVDHTQGKARKGFSITIDGQTELAKSYAELPPKEEVDDGIGFQEGFIRGYNAL